MTVTGSDDAQSETITTTPEHPFYVEGKGWVGAASLHEGMEVWLADGTKTTVEDVETEESDEPTTVYNFEVEDFHTYYVGESSVLVHNTCTQAPADGTKMTTSDALDAAGDYLGPGYSEVGTTGRFVSADGVRQVRMGVGEMLGTHAGGPHLNFDQLLPSHEGLAHVFLTDAF